MVWHSAKRRRPEQANSTGNFDDASMVITSFTAITVPTPEPTTNVSSSEVVAKAQAEAVQFNLDLFDLEAPFDG